MLQAHSFLWHYLWVAPNVLLLFLAFLIWKRGLHSQFPAFFCFAILSAVGQLALYGADIVPSIAPDTFWRVDWASLTVEGIVKFILVGEIFGSAFGSYASLARMGRFAIRTVGIVLIFAAALAAAYTPKDGLFGIVSGAHLLEQTVYIVESGLLVLIFTLSSYFHLSLSRRLFGIALGLSISSFVHLASWAVIANGSLPNSIRYDLDFITMSVYQACVFIWFYFLLFPRRQSAQLESSLVTASLEQSEGQEDWNRELERLIHQ
jgi:hypothetical protein